VTYGQIPPYRHDDRQPRTRHHEHPQQRLAVDVVEKVKVDRISQRVMLVRHEQLRNNEQTEACVGYRQPNESPVGEPLNTAHGTLPTLGDEDEQVADVADQSEGAY